MFEGFDQHELLAYVEDGLDPARAADLRQRLAAHPQAQRVLERLRQDRETLRSLESPAAPPDLMAELEPMLARPMLLPRQADWRRRYRRRRRWPLLAAVASLGLLVPAAIVAVSTGWLTRPAPVDLARARPEVPQPRPAPGPTTAAPGTGPTGGAGADAATLDRDPPQQVAGGTPPRGPTPAPRAPRPAGEPPRFAPAEFVLVVRSADESGVVDSLRRSLEDLGADGALVRNFTIVEAQELALGTRGEPRPEGLGPLARADAAEPRMPSSPMRREARQRPLIEERPAAEAPSSQLWGLRELAPGYDKQLEFSQRGAAYTVAIPAGRLADLLARLELKEGHQAALRVAPGLGGRSAPPAPGAPAAAHAWLHDYPLARAAIEDLRADPDAVIFLPVAIEK